MIQGFLFDFDNTIYDYDKPNNAGLEKIIDFIHNYFNISKDIINLKYKKINLNIKNSNNYSNKFNKSIYFKQLLEELNISLLNLDKILEIYNNEFNSNMYLFEGIIELFELLKNKNIKIGIISNNIFYQQYIKLQKLDLLKYIDIIQTSDEIGYEKPNKLIFLSAINKMNINCENIGIIGDNFSHDIESSIEFGLIPFYFKNNNSLDVKLCNKYFEFGNYNDLTTFLNNYFISEQEYIYLSKYFGQSILNIQGQGGNISVKSDGLLLIKSSGCILANTDLNTGFCIVNNNNCINLLKSNELDLKSIKFFGYKIPSMETYFHSFMKKYTIHLHFTLSNIFLCSNQDDKLKKLKINYKIINFYTPGLLLAQKIHELYSEDCDLYFLKNHGLIITSNNCNEVFNIYKYVYEYFNDLLENKYSFEYNCFNINEIIYKKFNKNIVCDIYKNISIDKIYNIKYCFPDLAVYIQNIYKIDNLNQIYQFDTIPEIILVDSNIYIISENLTKLYCIKETLDLYNELSLINYENLEIVEEKKIQNMEQEKYRKNN